jgi:hypothetical protein
VSSKKAYIVFRCSNCGFYSLASLRQKTRLCVRCGKTMVLQDTYNRRASDFSEARRLVGQLNSERGSETLEKNEGLRHSSTDSDLGIEPAKPSSKGLLRTFQELTLKYTNKEVNLFELLGECETHGIPRQYAQKLIRALIDNGQAYRPGKDRISFL